MLTPLLLMKKPPQRRGCRIREPEAGGKKISRSSTGGWKAEIKKRKAHSKKAQPEDCAHPTNPRQGD